MAVLEGGARRIDPASLSIPAAIGSRRACRGGRAIQLRETVPPAAQIPAQSDHLDDLPRATAPV